ncbi:MAG TPA: hypothetical protein VIX82_05775 [Solirubrobacteraceae bacterium]
MKGYATKTGAEGAEPRLMAIYLNDHLAGSTTALERVRHAAREHRSTELGLFLSRLAQEIDDDRQSLRRVMAAAGARPQRAKLAVAWIAEKVGRFKLNGRLLRRSPLTPFFELEVVETGIYGKLLLWQVLREQSPPGSAAVDLDELISRAHRQLGDVEKHRIAAGSALHCE